MAFYISKILRRVNGQYLRARQLGSKNYKSLPGSIVQRDLVLGTNPTSQWDSKMGFQVLIQFSNVYVFLSSNSCRGMENIEWKCEGVDCCSEYKHVISCWAFARLAAFDVSLSCPCLDLLRAVHISNHSSHSWLISLRAHILGSLGLVLRFFFS